MCLVGLLLLCVAVRGCVDDFLSFVNVFLLAEVYRGFEDGEGDGPATTSLR